MTTNQPPDMSSLCLVLLYNENRKSNLSSHSLRLKLSTLPVLKPYEKGFSFGGFITKLPLAQQI